MIPPHDAAERARAAQLFDDHVEGVHRYLARRLGTHLADDVVADVFEQAISQLDRFDERRGNERAWLFGIATNLIRRHWRSEERRLRAWTRVGHQTGPIGDPMLDIADRLDATSDAVTVMAKITELDETDRDLLFLVVWEECSYAACAESLDIPVGTVRSRLHRIRRQLRADSALVPTDPRLDSEDPS